MPKNTQLQSAGDYNLDSVLIVGSSGKRINVIEAGLPVPPGTLTRIMDIRRNAGQQ